MAQLVWNPVQAPNLDTRDVALAGQAIGASFDRLSTMLKDRYLEKKKDATNAAIAGQLAINDPTQLAANFDIKTLDKNADPAAVLLVRSQHYLEVMQQQGAREDLLNKQVEAKFGAGTYGMVMAAFNGDKEQQAQMVARTADDPEFARFVALHAQDQAAAAMGGVKFHEDIRQADRSFNLQASNSAADNARADASLALQRDSVNSAKADRQAAITGETFGEEAAKKYSMMPAERAYTVFLDSPEYKAKSPIEQATAKKGFAASFPIFAKATIARASDTLPTASEEPLARMATEMNKVSESLSTKGVDYGKLADSLDATVAHFYTPHLPNYGVRTIDTILSENKGATTADVAAAVQTLGPNVDTDVLSQAVGKMLDERVAGGSAAKILDLESRKAALILEGNTAAAKVMEQRIADERKLRAKPKGGR